MTISRKHGDFYKIPGSERRRHSHDEIIGPADENKVIQFQIYLKDRFKEEKNKRFEERADKLPADREYLTREEFASKYSANQEDIDKVKDFVNEYELKIEEVNPAARKITISGKIGSVNKAFNVQLQDHKDPSGDHIGREGFISIPSDLSDVVQGVFGLSRRKVIRPFLRLAKSLQENDSQLEEVSSSRSYLPNELAKLYNFPDDLDGNGQCIAILEFGGGFNQSDLQTYFSKLGIPLPDVSHVGPNQPGQPGNEDIDTEVALDIEVAATVAPKAKIVVYFFGDFEAELTNAITTALSDTINRPSVISISYGLWEEPSNWSESLREKVEGALVDAGIQNVTVCVSSGDSGSSTNLFPFDRVNYQVLDDKAHVAYPGSSPKVLSCGGTSLETSGNTITRETVWNENFWDDADQQGEGGATGGGISDFFPTIPDYQQNLNLPDRFVSINDGKSGRGVPDVSGYAAAVPGIDIIVNGKELAKGGHIIVDGEEVTLSGGVGGTSAVAPLWAGLIALFNQRLSKPAGFINNILYEKAAPAGAFRDITRGNNAVTYYVNGEGKVKIRGYSAQNGWDACTGLGSPDGKKILDILKG